MTVYFLRLLVETHLVRACVQAEARQTLIHFEQMPVIKTQLGLRDS